MSVKEIELAITQLSSSEIEELVDWLDEFQQTVRDEQSREGLRAGQLDASVEQASEDAILYLATDPVGGEIYDASVNHDRYLYTG